MVDRVELKPETPVEDPQHVEAMVNKASQLENQNSTEQTQEQPGEEQRPEWLPDKFKTPADLAKAYKELESKLGKKPAENEGGDPASPSDENTDELEIDNDKAQEELNKVGIDFNALAQEYTQLGKLSDETYASLEKAGIPRSEVDTYIEGRQALSEKINNEAFSRVGGKDQFNAMRTWAAQNYTPEERAAFNKAVNGSSADRNMALDALKAAYVAANGNEPDLVTGDVANSNANLGVYLSRAQVTADMKDPRYKTDPAFRKQVEAKLARSDVF